MKTLAKNHVCNHCVIGEKTFQNILIGPGKLPGLSRNGPQVWSPEKIALKTQIERVQRRATRWILKQRVGVMSYRDRLLTLKLLPLTFDRELKDLVFFLQMSERFY